NVLILGLDSAQQAISRTDVIMLAHVNPQAGTVSLVSVPRDTRVHLPGIGWTKINHAHVVGELNGGEQAGTQATVQAVSDLFQVPIHYYVKTDFTGFQGMIDEVGGIDVHLKQAVVLTDQHRTIPAGDQHLDGEMALKLARERYSLPDGDLGRQRHQSLILKALIHKALQPRQLQHVPQLISALHEDVLDTNLQDSDLISLAWLYRDLTDEQIHYQSLPGHSLYAQDPLVKAELYYWAADPQAVIEIAQEEFEQKGPPK
ncbi:MAG TPA: LCP family protein, partial [Bacilli bacterium]|nr:LCP family protein [Bacilli bacterium]